MTVTTALCPVCGTATQPQDSACSTCGLVFSSYAPLSAAPPTLPPLICPQCAQPTAAGSNCAACGAALTYQYQALNPSQTLAQGRYTVQHALSKGGMGAIYLATDHEAFDRTVVIKAMLDYFDPTDPHAVQAARERFLHEAKTLATLRHPAIPQIYTYFQDSTYNYIVMEYIEGHDLEQRLTHQDDASGRLIHGQHYPQAEVLRWGMALCRVLEYLAERKPHAVVHHDIKPANLLLDSDSGEIRLVDFGTAKARLLAGAGGMGLQKSSIHGTAGYAAPEQYRGESEPRSDIHALAATLYHLASNDDPRQHPFDFPQLPQLGAFGQVLRAALNPDAAQRSSAAAVYRQLEALSVLHSGRPLQAPDGSELTDVATLAVWCEQHWLAAMTWLYGKLPDQIELWWGQTRLAHDLRAITAQHTQNLSLGLDTALAQIDPQGFGHTTVRLISTTPILQYQKMTPRSVEHQELMIENVGRRHAALTIQKPPWISSASPATLNLSPGEHIRVNVTAYGDRLTVGGRVRDRILLQDGVLTLLEVEVQTFISRWWRLLMIGRAMLQPRALTIASALLTLILCCGGLPLYQAWNRPQPIQADPGRYALGVAAMERSAWQEAISQFENMPSNYQDTMARRKESYYQLGLAAIAQKDWAAARDALGRVPGYRDTAMLYRNANYNEAEQTGLLLQWTELPPSEISTHFLSPDGQIYGYVNANRQIMLYRVHDQSIVQTFAGHSGEITAAALSHDGQTLASGGRNGVIKLWNVRDGHLLHTMDGHVSGVTNLAFSADGQLLASGRESSDIKVWRVPDATLIQELGNGNGSQPSFAFSTDGQFLLASGPTYKARLWDIAKREVVWSFQEAEAQTASHMPTQTIAIAARLAIELWHVGSNQKVRSLAFPESITTDAMRFSPDGRLLAQACRDGYLRLWRVGDGELLQMYPTSGNLPQHLAFDSAGNLVTMSLEPGLLTVWRVPTE